MYFLSRFTGRTETPHLPFFEVRFVFPAPMVLEDTFSVRFLLRPDDIVQFSLKSERAAGKILPLPLVPVTLPPCSLQTFF